MLTPSPSRKRDESLRVGVRSFYILVFKRRNINHILIVVIESNVYAVTKVCKREIV